MSEFDVLEDILRVAGGHLGDMLELLGAILEIFQVVSDDLVWGAEEVACMRVLSFCSPSGTADSWGPKHTAGLGSTSL